MKLLWKTSEILLRCLRFCSWLGICHLTVTKWNSWQDFWEGRNREALKKAGVNLLPIPAKVTGERLILWNNTNDEIGPWNLTSRTVGQMFHPELLEQIQKTFCFTKQTKRDESVSNQISDNQVAPSSALHVQYERWTALCLGEMISELFEKGIY